MKSLLIFPEDASRSTSKPVPRGKEMFTSPELLLMYMSSESSRIPRSIFPDDASIPAAPPDIRSMVMSPDDASICVLSAASSFTEILPELECRFIEPPSRYSEIILPELASILSSSAALIRPVSILPELASSSIFSERNSSSSMSPEDECTQILSTAEIFSASVFPEFALIWTLLASTDLTEISPELDCRLNDLELIL